MLESKHLIIYMLQPEATIFPSIPFEIDTDGERLELLLILYVGKAMKNYHNA